MEAILEKHIGDCRDKFPYLSFIDFQIRQNRIQKSLKCVICNSTHLNVNTSRFFAKNDGIVSSSMDFPSLSAQANTTAFARKAEKVVSDIKTDIHETEKGPRSDDDNKRLGQYKLVENGIKKIVLLFHPLFKNPFIDQQPSSTPFVFPVCPKCLENDVAKSLIQYIELKMAQGLPKFQYCRCCSKEAPKQPEKGECYQDFVWLDSIGLVCNKCFCERGYSIRNTIVQHILQFRQETAENDGIYYRQTKRQKLV